MRALVVEHAEHETAGLLGDALRERKAEVDTRRMHRGEPLPPSVSDYHAVIVMGGPMSAWDDARHPHLEGEARVLGGARRARAPRRRRRAGLAHRHARARRARPRLRRRLPRPLTLLAGADCTSFRAVKRLFLIAALIAPTLARADGSKLEHAA